MMITMSNRFGKFYQCSSCGAWYPMRPDSIGAIGDYAYCPDCAKELASIEEQIVGSYVLRHNEIPTREYLTCIKHAVWYHGGVASRFKGETIRG